MFPRNDPDNCLYAPDVVSFAVTKGLYPKTADPNLFRSVFCVCVRHVFHGSTRSTRYVPEMQYPPTLNVRTCLYNALIHIHIQTHAHTMRSHIYTYTHTHTHSFSDVYDPVSFTSARFCEARVWAFFNRVRVISERVCVCVCMCVYVWVCVCVCELASFFLYQ